MIGIVVNRCLRCNLRWVQWPLWGGIDDPLRASPASVKRSSVGRGELVVTIPTAEAMAIGYPKVEIRGIAYGYVLCGCCSLVWRSACEFRRPENRKARGKEDERCQDQQTALSALEIPDQVCILLFRETSDSHPAFSSPGNSPGCSSPACVASTRLRPAAPIRLTTSSVWIACRGT